MKIPASERSDRLYNELVEDSLARLRNVYLRDKSHDHVLVLTADLKTALNELDNLRDELGKQVY